MALRLAAVFVALGLLTVPVRCAQAAGPHSLFDRSSTVGAHATSAHEHAADADALPPVPDHVTRPPARAAEAERLAPPERSRSRPPGQPGLSSLPAHEEAISIIAAVPTAGLAPILPRGEAALFVLVQAAHGLHSAPDAPPPRP